MFVTLVTQHAKSIFYIILSFVARLALPCFSTLFKKRHDSRKHFSQHEMCVLILSTTSFQKIYHSKKDAARYHRYTYAATESTHYSCQILMELEPSRHIFKKFANIKFNENPSSRNRFFFHVDGQVDGQTDRQTDMTKLIIAFCNFTKARKKV